MSTTAPATLFALPSFPSPAAVYDAIADFERRRRHDRRRAAWMQLAPAVVADPSDDAEEDVCVRIERESRESARQMRVEIEELKRRQAVRAAGGNPGVAVLDPLNAAITFGRAQVARLSPGVA